MPDMTNPKQIVEGVSRDTFKKEWWFSLDADPRIRIKVVRWTNAITDEEGNVIEENLPDWRRYRRDQFTWNYYLVIKKDDLLEPKKVAPRRVRDPERKWMRWDYSKSAFNDFEGWNGGITFAEVSGDFVTIGCDYAHSWDEGHTYSLTRIVYDAFQSAQQALPFLKPKHSNA